MVRAQQPPSCENLNKIVIPGLVVLSVEEIAAGSQVRTSDAKLPAHCLFHGDVNKHQGANGKSYGDIFELRLPVDWNGSFLFQGGGGLDGIVTPAIGAGSAFERPALVRGYAVVSTDGGHEADSKMMMSDGSFGSDPGALADYEYRSTRLVTDAAKNDY